MALRRFGIVSLASPEQPREAGSPQQWLNAHNYFVSQVAVFPNVLKSQETSEPMIPGRAAAALPAKLARARPRACRCFFTHSCKPLFSGVLGAGDLGYSVADIRQLCQVVCQLISHSRHCFSSLASSLLAWVTHTVSIG